MVKPAVHLAPGLLWRVLAAGVASLLGTVLLAAVLVGLGGALGPVGPETGPRLALLLALVPAAGALLATAVGLTWGASAVASLVRDAAVGAPPRLARSLGRAARSVPALLVLGAAGLLLVLASVVLWPLLTLVVLLRAAWRGRSAEARPAELSRLWLAVPLAPAAVLLTGLPTALAAAVSGSSPAGAARTAASQSWRSRLRVLVGLVALSLVSWGVGSLVTSSLGTVAEGGSTSAFALDTVLMGLGTLVLLVVAGVLLGIHTAHVAPDVVTTDAPGLRSDQPSARRRRGLVWHPARLGGTALLVAAALSLQLGAAGTTATVRAAEPAATVDVVVNDLADPATPIDGHCATPEATCGVRAALAKAASAGAPATVGFAVSGTVTLSSTLTLTGGVTLDGLDSTVVLDAHRAFRAVEVVSGSGGEGGPGGVLRRLTVQGGRSAGPGAGVFSDSTVLLLDRVVLRDNASGTEGGVKVDGGAVAVPHTRLSVVDSTFTGNAAVTGVGAAVHAASLLWTNSTSSGDLGAQGQPEGGAILAFDGTLRHATVIGSGGVAGVQDGIPLTVLNSVIDPSTDRAAFPCARVSGPDDATPSAGNVDPSGQCGGLDATSAPHGPLADNGGPTPTIALQPGSPAVGAGVLSSCATTDQRGVVRGTERCDAGAFQLTGSDTPDVAVALSAPTRSGLGDSVTLLATLSSASPIPAGKVRFLDGSAVLGTPGAPDSGGQASHTTTSLSQGGHQLRAEFVPADPASPVERSDARTLWVQAGVTLQVTASDPTRVHEPTTVTVLLQPAAGSDPALAPTGVVHLSSGSLSTDAVVTTTTVSGGGSRSTATWVVDALPEGRVVATYDGDPAFAAHTTTAVVTTENTATTTGAVLDVTRVEVGRTATLEVTLSDTVGRVDGEVELLVDDVAGNRVLLTGSRTSFPLRLPVGSYELVVRSYPVPGWSGSTSVPVTLEVVPTSSGVQVDAPSSVVYGAPLSVVATLSGEGPTQVRLVEGDRLLQEQATTLPSTLRLTAPELLPGAHDLVVEVVGSTNTAAAQSAPVTVTVTRAQPVLQVTPALAAPGATSRLAVTAASAGSLAPTGALRLVSSTGAVLGTGRLDAGAGEVAFVAGQAGLLRAGLELEPDAASPYTSARSAQELDIPKGVPGAATATWSVDPRPGDARLTVTVPAGPVPHTGTVSLVADGTVLASAALPADGSNRVVLSLDGPGGRCFGCTSGLTVRYSGDSNWTERVTPIDPFFLPAAATTTALVGTPAVVGRDETVPLRAEVSTLPWTGVSSGSVRFLVDNGASQLVPVTTDGSGRAVALWTYAPQRPGSHVVTAEFVPGGPDTSGSRSGQVTFQVDASPLPVVVLTGPAAGAPLPQVGKPLRVEARPASATSSIRLGSPVTLSLDDPSSAEPQRVSSTWRGTQQAPVAVFDVVPVHGGTTVLTAAFRYGTDVALGTSEPLELLVAGAAFPLVLALDMDNGPPTVGAPVYLAATPSLTDAQRQAAGTMSLQLLADGVAVGQPVTWFPSSVSARFSHSPAAAGDVVYTVVTAGDGRDLGAARGTTTIAVQRFVPGLLVNGGTVPLGSPWVAGVTLQGPQSLPAPTGRVTTEALLGGVRKGYCEAVLPATCTLTGLPAGLLELRAAYLGDALFAPTTATGAVLVSFVSSTISPAFSPAPADWLVGAPAEVTWSVSLANGASPVGNVEVRSSTTGLLCTAPVDAGGCRFVVPPNKGERNDADAMTVRTTFLTDQPVADARSSVSALLPRRCLPVTTSARADVTPAGGLTAPTVSGQGCSVAGVTGFVEDTVVTVTPVVPPGYEVNSWSVRGTAYEPFGGLQQLVVQGPLTVVAYLAFVPACHWVDVTTEYENRFGSVPRPRFFDGRLAVITPPNCPRASLTRLPSRDNPLGESGYYLEGTTVAVHPIPSSDIGGGEFDYRVLDVPGTTEPDATSEFFRFTVEGPRTVFAQFRLSSRMCTATTLHLGAGGRMRVASSYVPEGPLRYRLERFDGKCLSPAGTPGYLLGTTVELEAQGRNSGLKAPREADQFFFKRWVELGDLKDDATATAALTPKAQGDYPGDQAYGAVRRSVVIPRAFVARYGAAFGFISCVPLEVSLEYPRRSDDGGAVPALTMTPTTCSAKEPTSSTSRYRPDRGSNGLGMDDNNVQTLKRVEHYLPGTAVKVSATPEEMTVSSLKPTEKDPKGPMLKRRLSWSVTDPKGTVGSAEFGSRSVVVSGTRKLSVHGHFAATNCFTPRVVTRPAGATWTVLPSLCPAGQLSPTGGVIEAEPLATGPEPTGRPSPSGGVAAADLWATGTEPAGEPRPVERRPVWWTYGDDDFPGEYLRRVVPGSLDRTYVAARAVNPGPGMASQQIFLDHCVPLPVTISLVDAAGTPVQPRERVNADEVLTDADDCPAALMVLPGTSTQIGLSREGVARFTQVAQTVNGAAVPAPARLAVDAEGVKVDRATITLTARCHVLDVDSRVRIDTAANCPGAGQGEPHRKTYLRGTVVTIEFVPVMGDKFKRWLGVDVVKENAAEGEEYFAAVVMSRDRAPITDYYRPGPLEQFVAIASHLAQKVVAGLVAAATGLVMGLLYVVQGVALLAHGISLGLRAAGVSGVGLDKLDAGLDLVNSGLDLIQSVQDCSTQWATGGSGPALSPPDDADTGVDVASGLGEAGLERLKHTKAAGRLGAAGTIYGTVNIFAGGLSNMLSDPTDAWSSAADIGGCVKDKGLAVRDAGRALG